MNPDKGDFEIYRNRVVVADGEVEDENKEIALAEARKIEPDYEVGEDVSEKVDFNKFGRREIRVDRSEEGWKDRTRPVC